MKRLLAAASLSCALLAGSALGSPLFAAVNLLVNPGLEDAGGGYSGWTTFGSGVQLSTPTTDNIFRSGAAAAKIFGGFGGCPGPGVFNVVGFFQAFTPTVGQNYQLSGFSFVSSADPMLGTDICNKNRAIAKIVFWDAPVGGNQISANEVIIGNGSTPINQWLPFEVSLPAPAGALRVETLILFLQPPGCDPGSVFVDDLSLSALPAGTQPNLLTNSNFASGLSGWGTFGNAVTEARNFAVRTAPGSAALFSTFVAATPSGLFQTFPATPGVAWKLDAYSMTTCQENPITGVNDNYVTARIVFKDAGGTEIGANETVILDKTSPLGTWTGHSVVANAPAATASASAYILFNSPSLLGGKAWIDDLNFHPLSGTGVRPENSATAMELHPNVPNPFHASTRIEFAITRPDLVDIGVFDIAGRRVVTLFNGRLEPGTHQVSWSGATSNGTRVSNGVYRCVMRTSTGQLVRSMVLTD